MDPKPGTVELLIQEAKLFLNPLFATIEQDGIQAFLEKELDVDIPSGTFHGAAITTSINQCKNAIQSLSTIIDELRTAIENKDYATVATKSIDAVAQIKTINDGVKALGENAKSISASLPAPLSAQLSDFCERIVERIVMLLTIIYADKNLISIEALHLLGVFAVEEVSIGGTSPPKTVMQEKIYLNRLIDLMRSPAEHLKSMYRWGEDDFEGELFLERLNNLMLRNNIVATFFPATGTQRAFIDSDFFKIEHHKEGAVQGLSVLHKIPIPDHFSLVNPISKAWSLALNVTGAFKDAFKWLLSAPGNLTVLTPNEANASLSADFTGLPVAPIERLPLLSILNIGSVDASKINCLFRFDYAASSTTDPTVNFAFETVISGGRIEIGFSEDGFLSSICAASSYKVDFDLSVSWSAKNGFVITGSTSPEITLPVHQQIGPLSITSIVIGIHPVDGKIKINAGASLSTTLGPLSILVNDIGLSSSFSFPPTVGNLGPLQVDIGFKPPSGAGLTVDAGGIKGGGILDFNPEKQEYFGALELEFKDLFSLKAFGIINTRLPDGNKGFSLLIIVTAEFNPVQLGLGFTLNGVGGLLGVHRTAKVEVLKEGIKTNTLKSILFPENVVANIDRIVSDIKQVFPPLQDHFLICPMGKIGWGTPTIITLELGILIEIPASDLKILGVLRALLPEEKNPLLKLQVNFLGIIDFENRFISFDASLYDSKILTFTLTGDMALRIGFGDKHILLLSVGGFHPSFKEVPADLKNMRRITLSLYDGKDARIIIQTYLAITSNTAQFGAKAELFAQKGSFNIYGFIGYDVLFQFLPFKFIADFGAGVALRRHSSVIMSIRVSGQLSGPKPWDARGEASVSFFFFSVSVPFHVTWGDSNNDLEKLTEDLLALLQSAINDNRNWLASIPANNKLHVSIRTISESEMAVHPFGILTFSERLVPLEIEINKYGNKLPKDVRRFEIKVDDANLKTDEAREQFAPANFFNMKDDEKLARPSFEHMKSGFKITGSAKLTAPSHIVSKSVDYEFSYLGKERKPKPDIYVYPGRFFKAHTKSAAVSQSMLSHANNRVSMNAPHKITVKEEQYVVANISDMKLHSSEMVAASYTEALQKYNQLIGRQPELRDKVQVLSEYELNTV